ncbi:MAG: hypothetical protein LCH34_06745 [Firmicutes bacterium]|nr:hypothetical protein [Bacillota bacterium]
MKRLLFVLIIMTFGFISTSCGDTVETGRLESSGAVEGFDFSDEDNNLEMTLSNMQYGKPFKLGDEWENYRVTTESPDDRDPNHTAYEKIDEDYFLVRVSRSSSGEKSSYQDLVLLAYHLSKWNQNSAWMPVLLQHNNQYALSVSPFYYDSSKDGYDDVLNILRHVDPMTEQQDNAYSIIGLQLKSDFAAYGRTRHDIQLSYLNQSQDEFVWKGDFLIDKNSDGKWITVYTSKQSNENEVIIHENELKSLVFSIDRKYKDLEIGDYRISFNYYRRQQFGIPYRDTSYPVYKAEATFLVSEIDLHYSLDYDKVKDIFPGIEFEPEFQVYPLGTTHVKVKWRNNSTDGIIYGAYFILEQKVDNEWHQIKLNPDDDIMFPLMAYNVNPGENAWYEYPINLYSYADTTGEYRIHTRFMRKSLNGKDFGSGKYPDYDIYAYFRIN